MEHLSLVDDPQAAGLTPWRIELWQPYRAILVVWAANPAGCLAVVQAHFTHWLISEEIAPIALGTFVPRDV
jgi:hypothetical protein